MGQNNLWSKVNYLAPYPCIINNYITEYDISKANINILLYYGAINKNTYDVLYYMDKKNREIYVGKMERSNPDITKIKANGIEEFRHRFFEANGLENKDILSIKNDAVFVIGKDCRHTQFDNIVFNRSSVYTCYMHIGRLEAYYSFDPIHGNEILDIKGIKDYKLELHREYMISHLCDVFYRLQTSSIEDAIKCNSDLLQHYLSRSLPKGFYREFNAESRFRLNSSFNTFTVDSIDDNELECIDISTNANVLRNISGCISAIYFSKINGGKNG